VSRNFRDLAVAMNFSNDDFIRTTEPRHIAACQAIWRALRERGQIYLGAYSGWYAVRDEAFYGEDELVDGPGGKKIAKGSGAECEWVEEPSYFFKLSAWQEPLLRFYEENPDAVAPASRRNEVISFVKSGLQDLSVSRTTFKWGIPVPDDPAHIMYVWLDALTNYITAAGYPDTGSIDYRTYWPADLHMVGKDILRFHAVYWPAFLMAAGLEPPRRVFAHGWWTNEGQKISKSLGNVIDPVQLIERYGLDQVRYFLLREVPFGQDGDFSNKAIVGRINADLANGLGNLAQRTLAMIHKNCGGMTPSAGRSQEADEALRTTAVELTERVRSELSQQSFHRALDAIWQVIGQADRYLNDQAPWSLKNSDPDRMASVLYVAAEAIRRIAILVQPFMPASAERLLDQLGVAAERRGIADLSASASLLGGVAIPKPEGVFPRFMET
jgi:methionyl-tRNA synthetase